MPFGVTNTTQACRRAAGDGPRTVRSRSIAWRRMSRKTPGSF